MATSKRASRIREMAAVGLLFGKIYCALAVVIFLIVRPATFWREPFLTLGVFVLYLVGGVLAGVVVGVLYPLTKWFLGRIVTGIIAAFPLGLIGGLLVLPREKWVILPQYAAFAAVFFGVIGALALTFVLRER